MLVGEGETLDLGVKQHVIFADPNMESAVTLERYAP